MCNTSTVFLSDYISNYSQESPAALPYIYLCRSLRLIRLLSDHNQFHGAKAIYIRSWFIVWYCALPWKYNITKKVNLPLSMPRRHVGEDEVQLCSFLTTQLGKGKWLTLPTGCFERREQAPDTLWIKVWVDPGDGLGILDNREMSCSCWESNPASYSP